ncbi:MAG: ABC transporter permease subunit [Candidatus Sungbacteria bacterium]|nr:ABC transporter permease subunit [Candidatus Sungbacteria bacterium]
MRSVRRHHSASIYASRTHLFATLFIVVAPLVFFLLFSRLVHIALGELLGSISASLLRLFAAYLIALLLAWTCAVLFYHGKRAIVALPVFDVLQNFPTFAVLPIGILLIGSSNATIIFFLVLSIIWPILFSVLSSLKLAKRDWAEAVHIAQLSGWQYMRLFLIPITIPGVITGSVIGLGEGWGAIVATEIIIGAPMGLGSFFNTHALDGAITTFGVFGILLLIFSINKLLWLPLLEWSHREMEE